MAVVNVTKLVPTCFDLHQRSVSIITNDLCVCVFGVCLGMLSVSLL